MITAGLSRRCGDGHSDVGRLYYATVLGALIKACRRGLGCGHFAFFNAPPLFFGASCGAAARGEEHGMQYVCVCVHVLGRGLSGVSAAIRTGGVGGALCVPVGVTG